jgi:hypothetical protein
MKLSVRRRARKWSFGGFVCDQWPIVALAMAFATAAVAALAASTVHPVPLPQPRPVEAPENPEKIPDRPAEQKPAEEKPAADAAPAAAVPPAPSACRLALTESIAIAPSIPPITGPGACGGEDMVRLETIMLPDNKGSVAVKPAAVLRCTMASAIADWIRTDMTPLAEAQDSKISDLENLDSFECRGRNRVVGAKLSEHGRANALDVSALKLANGASIALTDRSVPRETREAVLHSVCARFTTVLGPGSDGYHEDHIHLDLAERHNGYRICQWEVWDALPPIAPLLPAERPEQAPPRDVAEQVDGNEKTDPKPTATPALPAEAAAPPVAARAGKPAPDDHSKPELKPKSKPKPRKHRTVARPFSFFR